VAERQETGPTRWLTKRITGTRRCSVKLAEQRFEGTMKSSTDYRALKAFNVRLRAARLEESRSHGIQTNNGDESRYPNRIASYSKGLRHDALGEVVANSYESLLHALKSVIPAAFEQIILGGDRKLTNPMAGLAFCMQGPDPGAVRMRPAPCFSSAEQAGELVESYWMSLARDIPFLQYDSNSIIDRAVRDLRQFASFDGVASSSIFRGDARGVCDGPFVSQFLWKAVTLGAQTVNPKIRTGPPGLDHAVTFSDWLLLQTGNTPWPSLKDPIARYIRNGRDLSHLVHYDVLFQVFVNALYILYAIGARRSRHDPYLKSETQAGFLTFGSAHIESLLCAVVGPALRATWYQKWFVHRRSRPESFAGRLHNHVLHLASYPFHSDLFRSNALDEIYSRNRTYLLPQAYPEGCPTHPSYPAGHAAVAGACTTILKAFFDEEDLIRQPVQPSIDGTALVPYEGSDLTVKGELNKLAYNIAIGRNFAGIHWRSDAEESLKLGEDVAIAFLREERACLPESFQGYSFTRFDGSCTTV